MSDAARGYSDPAGYSATGKERFNQLDLATEFPFLRKVGRATNALTFPNGRVVPAQANIRRGRSSEDTL